MVYEIQEISTEKSSGHTYVLVHFWNSQQDKARGLPPLLIEEFLMQLQATGERVVTNAQGHLKRKDGTFVDRATIDPKEKLPREDFEIETFPRSPMQEMQGNIERHMAKAEARGWRGDSRSKEAPFVRTEDDPHGVLSASDIAAERQAIAQRRARR